MRIIPESGTLPARANARTLREGGGRRVGPERRRRGGWRTGGAVARAVESSSRKRARARSGKFAGLEAEERAKELLRISKTVAERRKGFGREEAVDAGRTAAASARPERRKTERR